MAQRGAPKSSKKPAKKKAAGKRPARKAVAGKKTSGVRVGTGDAAELAGGHKQPAAAKRTLANRGQVNRAAEPVAPDAHELAHECERLRAELKKAREEIKDLKGRQDYVLNRIDWAIDSLHSLLEESD